jgi:hypothetical protein
MVLIFVLVMVITLGGAQGVFAYTVEDDGEPVHEYIAEQALAIYAASHPNSEIELWFPTVIKIGAGNEDLKDHVYDRSGACTTTTHFWDVDEGIGDPVYMAGCGECANAWQKAEILWGMAVGEYNSGDLLTGYEYLGHVVHLLGDMSVPAHVHEDKHYPDDDCYEDWMTLANAELSDTEKADLGSLGPVVIPDGVDPLYYLFYTTNQVADFFASDDYDGDTDDLNGGWMNGVNGVYTELGMDSITSPVTAGQLTNNDETLGVDNDNNGDLDLGVIRDYSYKFAIRATATLYELFSEAVSGRPALTVVIDNVVAKDCHDEGLAAPDCRADFFVEVCINGAWYRNEGNQIVDEDGISPGWAFGRDVGLSGSIPIRILLWDEDEEGSPGGDDDPSDIDPQTPVGERQLNFWVDLATGAISGEDISGTCGTPLVVEGECETDNDESIMTFTVILPNQPPTAHAGDDQTVSEGDTVTLVGTFTDPNVGDTHTFLWHMESSTNGQVIPDSSGPAFPEPSTQPFSFVPCDNGVYTFNFTVTDNYGAQGSDTVVVTALNVLPVVTDVYISSQPNAEFILPVVHEIDFEGTFTDAGMCDTHTAGWEWGDGTTSDSVVTESGGSGTAAGSHTYSVPGDYTVILTVTDDDGGTNYDTVTVHVADVDEALDIFNAHIKSLPNSKFRFPITANLCKAAFKKRFLRLDVMLAVHNYPWMIVSLNFDIRTKFDALVGGGRIDDWIKQDLAIQTELCQKVDDITAYLMYLLLS